MHLHYGYSELYVSENLTSTLGLTDASGICRRRTGSACLCRYYSTDWSMGFTNVGEYPNRNSCDTNSGSYPQHRMCWHSSGGNLNAGWRCGSATSVSSGWNRRIYHRWATASPTPTQTTAATTSRVSDMGR